VKPPERVYYRVYRDLDTKEYAVFLLYEWPDQAIPPHGYDYEPVIVILDKDMEIKKVYTDCFPLLREEVHPATACADQAAYI